MVLGEKGLAGQGAVTFGLGEKEPRLRRSSRRPGGAGTLGAEPRAGVLGVPFPL